MHKKSLFFLTKLAMSSQAILSEHTFFEKSINTKNHMLLWIETRESDGSRRVESGHIHGKGNKNLRDKNNLFTIFNLLRLL